jgi:hypothetical protein
VKEGRVHFFVLEHPKKSVDDALTDFLPEPDTKRGDAPRCPKCGTFIGMMPDIAPLRVEIETWGRRFGDLAFGVSNEVLVSERFKDAFLSSDLSGFSGFLPTEIVKVTARQGKVPEQIPSYSMATPGRSRAAIDDRASGIDYESPWTCEECRSGYKLRLRRLVLEPNTWSGEDVFIARGLPGTIVTSERFKEFCDRNTFSNCLLIEAERYHFDFFPWRRDAGAKIPAGKKE